MIKPESVFAKTKKNNQFYDPLFLNKRCIPKSIETKI